MTRQEPPPLMDWMRPLDSDGTLQSVLLSTYGLSLGDPPFFEQDFLPTLLGLGGVRERGYATPANVERRLGQFYCGLICDAHALAHGGRPSLRVDVIPIGHQVQHAKILLIHREHLVRLVIASANLTHEGFRRNREAAAVLDFHERSDLSPTLLVDFASQWIARLGRGATQDFRRALEGAVSAAQRWKPAHATELRVQTLWGGSEPPLWRQVLDAWPHNERLQEWQICCPFWPSPGDSETPFDVFRRELDARGAKVADARIRLFAMADVPGPRGRPYFPFALIEQVAQRGFNPVDAAICPVRLDALETEVSSGKAAENRPLHAKWILLRGERTSLLILGSANFTRRGFGVLHNPSEANMEVVVLVSGPTKVLSTDHMTLPLADDGIVQWRDCRVECLATPPTEIEVEPWPEFIISVELEVRWETLPLCGSLHIRCASAVNFSLVWEKDDDQLPLSIGVPSAENIFTVQLDETQISALLIRRRVIVLWRKPTLSAYFPINITSASKPGLPAVLGQNPTEQDLLAYFHGRIDEEDLMTLLIERSRQQGAGNGTMLAPPGRELQNYVVREFLEGLYGMEELLRDSVASPRIFEQALLGEFSPVRLANETLRAYSAGRRTSTATGFQLLELLRLVENLTLHDSKMPLPPWFMEMQERAREQLLRFVRSASTIRPDFRESCNAAPFRELVAMVLKRATAARWQAAIEP